MQKLRTLYVFFVSLFLWNQGVYAQALPPQTASPPPVIALQYSPAASKHAETQKAMIAVNDAANIEAITGKESAETQKALQEISKAAAANGTPDRVQFLVQLFNSLRDQVKAKHWAHQEEIRLMTQMANALSLDCDEQGNLICNQTDCATMTNTRPAPTSTQPLPTSSSCQSPVTVTQTITVTECFSTPTVTPRPTSRIPVPPPNPCAGCKIPPGQATAQQISDLNINNPNCPRYCFVVRTPVMTTPTTPPLPTSSSTTPVMTTPTIPPLPTSNSTTPVMTTPTMPPLPTSNSTTPVMTTPTMPPLPTSNSTTPYAISSFPISPRPISVPASPFPNTPKPSSSQPPRPDKNSKPSTIVPQLTKTVTQTPPSPPNPCSSCVIPMVYGTEPNMEQIMMANLNNPSCPEYCYKKPTMNTLTQTVTTIPVPAPTITVVTSVIPPPPVPVINTLTQTIMQLDPCSGCTTGGACPAHCSHAATLIVRSDHYMTVTVTSTPTSLPEASASPVSFPVINCSKCITVPLNFTQYANATLGGANGTAVGNATQPSMQELNRNNSQCPPSCFGTTITRTVFATPAVQTQAVLSTVSPPVSTVTESKTIIQTISATANGTLANSTVTVTKTQLSSVFITQTPLSPQNGTGNMTVTQTMPAATVTVTETRGNPSQSVVVSTLPVITQTVSAPGPTVTVTERPQTVTAPAPPVTVTEKPQTVTAPASPVTVTEKPQTVTAPAPLITITPQTNTVTHPPSVVTLTAPPSTTTVSGVLVTSSIPGLTRTTSFPALVTTISPPVSTVSHAGSTVTVTLPAQTVTMSQQVVTISQSAVAVTQTIPGFTTVISEAPVATIIRGTCTPDKIAACSRSCSSHDHECFAGCNVDCIPRPNCNPHIVTECTIACANSGNDAADEACYKACARGCGSLIRQSSETRPSSKTIIKTRAPSPTSVSSSCSVDKALSCSKKCNIHDEKCFESCSRDCKPVFSCNKKIEEQCTERCLSVSGFTAQKKCYDECSNGCGDLVVPPPPAPTCEKTAVVSCSTSCKKGDRLCFQRCFSKCPDSPTCDKDLASECSQLCATVVNGGILGGKACYEGCAHDCTNSPKTTSIPKSSKTHHPGESPTPSSVAAPKNTTEQCCNKVDVAKCSDKCKKDDHECFMSCAEPCSESNEPACVPHTIAKCTQSCAGKSDSLTCMKNCAADCDVRQKTDIPFGGGLVVAPVNDARAAASAQAKAYAVPKLEDYLPNPVVPTPVPCTACNETRGPDGEIIKKIIV